MVSLPERRAILPVMNDETRDRPPTDDEVRGAFAAFLKDRADNRVLLAKSADVSFEDGVVTVVFYPAAAVPDPAVLMELSPYENHAQFAGMPIVFENEEGRWLRQVVKRVETRLADGTDLGSLTAAQLYKIGTGQEMPE